jgi:nitroreductase
MDPNSTATTGPDAAAALHAATEAAVHAPSIFNTQPWRWLVRPDGLNLFADHSRQLEVSDPGGRMLTISCGIALHHALIALGAAGWQTSVDACPTDDDPDLLARITLTGNSAPSEADARLLAAVAIRHTDRRPFADAPIPDSTLEALRQLAEAQHTYLSELHGDQLLRFQVAAGRAAELDQTDPAYQAELAEWTHRPADSGDGVPATATVAPGPRRVPLRGFLPEGEDALPAGPGHDKGARYLVLWSEDDYPPDWLAAGQALSAILLEAAAAGLAASPMSDTIENPSSRALMQGVLSGIGHAHTVLRIGIPVAQTPLTATPRRPTGDVVTN